MNSKVINLPGLNGLRAIAAVAVVISHTTLSLQAFGLDPGIFGRDREGNPIGLLLSGFGVSIFFALSGFLITYLLLKEKEVARINVRKFYVRRALRIWPLYYPFLVICLLVAHVHGDAYEGSSIWYYVFLSANIPFIIGQTLPYVAHYWSLGVEEQFYLFWPWLARMSNRKLLLFSMIAVVALIAAKLASRIFDLHIGSLSLYDIIHVTRFHCMLIGAVGAILYYQQHRLFIAFCTSIWTQAASWLVIFLVTINKFHTASIIDNELISCVTVCLILGQITGRNRIINLNNPLCNFLGKISYGLYVIHPLIILAFTLLLRDLTIPVLPRYLLIYGLVLSATVLVAYISYHFYEKRFLRWKVSFAVIKSSDTSEPKEPMSSGNIADAASFTMKPELLDQVAAGNEERL